MEKISFFDAIEENKRNSILLILGIFIIFFVLIFLISEMFDLGIFGYLIGFFILLGYVLFAYYKGGEVILLLSGAKQVRKSDYPYLYNVVEGLAIAAGIPMPKIYVIEDKFPNAFATGRDPEHSAIAVTTGLLETMNKDELSGVVAHEISHIGNYDIRFMMLTIALVGAIGLISDIFLRSFLRGGGERKKGGAILLIGVLFMILAPIAAFLVRMAISRQREYLADANAAKLTRYPNGLASALEKIKNYPEKMKTANETIAALYIADPFKSVSGLFATHPPIDDRIARLRKM